MILVDKRLGKTTAPNLLMGWSGRAPALIHRLPLSVGPSTAAAAYGVPAGAKPHLRAYLSAKGIRDIASGLFAAILKQPPNASGDQHRRRTFHRCRSWLIVPRISLNVPDQLLVVIALLERRK
jgi:hypothetical protein